MIARVGLWLVLVCGALVVASPMAWAQAGTNGNPRSSVDPTDCDDMTDVMISAGRQSFPLRAADMLCLDGGDGERYCQTAASFSLSSYTCPNGTTITCSADCDKCGGGAVGACGTCCAHYHPDPNGQRNCKSNYC